MNNNPYNADYFEHGKKLGLSCYERYRWLPELTVPMAQALVDGLGISKRDTILDFGCAKGFVVKALRLLGYDARGCDISEYAINAADSETRPYLHLLDKTGRLPSSGGTAWDWIIAKDVLEHLTARQIRFNIAEFYANGLNVFAAIPLGDGEKFIIPEMDLDVTHVTRRPLAWWMEQFYQHGFARVQGFNEMKGIKENWTKPHPFGNGFIIAS